MSFEDELAKEVGKQVPVAEIYKDMVQPAGKEVGGLGEDAAKTLRLILAPLQIAAALQDRLALFLDKSVRKIPEEERVSPPIQILGPVIDGIRYEPDDTDIYQTYCNLLANSMDERTAGFVHPAYPKIIQQLSSDEVKILNFLRDVEPLYIVEKDLQKQGDRVVFVNPKILRDDFPKDMLALPQRVEFYFDHMSTLGIAIMTIIDEVPIFHPDALRERVQTGIKITVKYVLTKFGKDFINACVRAD